MLTIQSAKDTFYVALRDRIAAINPARTIVVRGVLRPAALVVENEAPGAAVDGIAPAETFCLRWPGLEVDTTSAGPLARLVCEIRYASDGSTGAGGLDRGRALAAMDAELLTALTTTPQNSPALAIAETAPGSATESPTGENIFWGTPAFGSATARGERLERSVQIEVFAYAS